MVSSFITVPVLSVCTIYVNIKSYQVSIKFPDLNKQDYSFVTFDSFRFCYGKTGSAPVRGYPEPVDFLFLEIAVTLDLAVFPFALAVNLGSDYINNHNNYNESDKNQKPI